jgi:hypothetical protein
MVGALIIEPEGATWVEDITTRAAATVIPGDKAAFREFVVVDQNMVANSNDSNSPLNAVAGGVVGAINFRSEPFTIRSRPSNAQDLPQPAPQGFSQAFSNSLFNPPPIGNTRLRGFRRRADSSDWCPSTPQTARCGSADIHCPRPQLGGRTVHQTFHENRTQPIVRTFQTAKVDRTRNSTFYFRAPEVRIRYLVITFTRLTRRRGSWVPGDCSE